MALSGTFQNYPVSSFGLYCEWSGTQSITGNYPDVTLKVYLSYYTLDVGARSDSTISINGVSETYTAPPELCATTLALRAAHYRHEAGYYLQIGRWLPHA